MILDLNDGWRKQRPFCIRKKEKVRNAHKNVKSQFHKQTLTITDSLYLKAALDCMCG